MSDNAHRALRFAALGFAGNVGFGTLVAIRDNLPGRPLGIQVPLSVPAGILVGWGAGVAAPWPMPVAAVMAAAHVEKEDAGLGSGLVCAGIGMAGIVGLLIEPNTYRRSQWSVATRASITLGFLTSAALAAAGLRLARDTSRSRPREQSPVGHHAVTATGTREPSTDGTPPTV